VFTDAKTGGNPIVFANDSFLKLTGYDRDEVLAQRFDFILDAEADEAIKRKVDAAFEVPSDESPSIECRRKDGSKFCADILVNAVKDDDGDVIQHFVSLVDTTRFLQAQQNAAMLIDELNHRVKNTLATVQSIVTQAVRNETDVHAVQQAIETRIAALSRSHDLLGREKWDGAGLRELIDEALAPFRTTAGHAERFVIAGEDMRLSPKATLALGIAFNELATNAVKYGAFSNESGTVSIRWTLDRKPEGRRLCLHWREEGGPPVTPPKRKGFGSRVIERGLAHELGGTVTLEYLPAGIVCTIDVPAPQAVLDG
jgi:PAS domain S-box-containing protein